MHLSLQWGKTALMIAFDLGHIECVKMLVDKGAQVNIQDTVSLSGVVFNLTGTIYTIMYTKPLCMY